MADLSDDSSASSGEHILNMVLPFSQETKSSDKASGDEGDGGSGESAALEFSDKKRKHKELAIESTHEKEAEEKARENARKAFIDTFKGIKVGGPDKLFWLQQTKKRKKVVSPVRAVPLEEIVGLNLKWNDEKQCPIQYIEYRTVGKYWIASKRGLSPYHGNGDDDDQWCPTKFEQYSKQLKKAHKDLKTEQLYLQCVLQKSLEEGEWEKKMAEVDEAVAEEIFIANNEQVCPEKESDEEGGEEEMRWSKRSRRLSTGIQERREPLRKGDVIEFYKHQCVAGDPSGLMEATVLAIDPKGGRILTLDDPLIHLGPHHKVKRIKRFYRGKLVDHGGHFRSIINYELKKQGNPNASLKDSLAKNKAQVDEVIQRNKERAVAKMKKDGLYIADVFRV